MLVNAPSKVANGRANCAARLFEIRKMSKVYIAVDMFDIRNGDSWMTPAVKYLADDQLPNDPA